MLKPRLVQHISTLFGLPYWHCTGDSIVGEGTTPYQAFADWAIRCHTYQSIPRVADSGEGYISIKRARRYLHYIPNSIYFPSEFVYHNERWYVITGYKSATDEIIIRG